MIAFVRPRRETSLIPEKRVLFVTVCHRIKPNIHFSCEGTGVDESEVNCEVRIGVRVGVGVGVVGVVGVFGVVFGVVGVVGVCLILSGLNKGKSSLLREVESDVLAYKFPTDLFLRVPLIVPCECA